MDKKDVEKALGALDLIYKLSTKAPVPMDPDHLMAQQCHRFVRGLFEKEMTPVVEKKTELPVVEKKVLTEKEEG